MEFRWIQISLFLTALLHFTGAATQHIVRARDDVTLSCENVIKNQSECSYTTWLFSRSTNSAAVELVTLGQIGVNAGAKSNRLRVTEDCSLLIKKVTEEDVGRYDCQQYSTSEKQVPDADVYLSVLSMTEQTNGDSVTLICSVRTYEMHACRVKWLNEGKDVSENSQSLAKAPLLWRLCYINVTFANDQHVYASGYNSLQCEVTLDENKQLFPFRRRTSDWLWLYITVAVVLFAALLITVVFVITWKRTRGNTPERNEDVVCYDEDDDTASYVNIQELSAMVRRY